eukprot:TRINITY_DN4154_c0_g1_i2.p1 TRINITY_DN4154_c0_g1~~TRINITY_DN4154_c0_g1_i2.p1  ORF type:complete len:390 (+),score=32.42 TRINITY_DN4154_c0_g1_i2:97-1266(+)
MILSQSGCRKFGLQKHTGFNCVNFDVKNKFSFKRTGLICHVRNTEEVETLTTLKNVSDPVAVEMMAKLKADQVHLFDDVGIDPTLYEDVVDFRDPVTKYDNIQGYIFNIKMLKNVFRPDYILHEIRQTGENEITTRWTMTMKFFLGRMDPIKRFWQPKLVFTGTSVMGYNPLNKRFNKHWDFWDSLENNEYLSLEGVAEVFKQLVNLQIVQDIETPEYVTYIKKKEFEIRQYKPFKAASVSVEGGESFVDPESRNAKKAYDMLLRYMQGGNEEGTRMKMTTPIYSTSGSRMVVSVGSDSGDSIPKPLDQNVHVRQIPGDLMGVVSFNGAVNEAIVTQKFNQLKRDLSLLGMQTGDAYLLARYNDKQTNPFQRTNEVLVQIKSGFDLWSF